MKKLCDIVLRTINDHQLLVQSYLVTTDVLYNLRRDV